MLFDNTDKAIIRYLYRANRWVSTGEVATKTGIAPSTARFHLDKLLRIGYVESGQRGKVLYWTLVTREERERALRRLEQLGL